MGHFYLLRSSEYLAVNGTVARTAITAADVSLFDNRGRICSIEGPGQVDRVDIRLRGSKTDQEVRSKDLSLARSGSGWLCPVLAVLDLLLHAKSLRLLQSSPLAAVDHRTTIKAATLIARLRVAATDCGIEPGRFGTHSLRVGGATAMMAAGIDLQTIKLFGRWVSDSVDRYTRLSSASTRVLSARMAERSVTTQQPEANQVGSALHAHH